MTNINTLLLYFIVCMLLLGLVGIREMWGDIREMRSDLKGRKK